MAEKSGLKGIWMRLFFTALCAVILLSPVTALGEVVGTAPVPAPEAGADKMAIAGPEAASSKGERLKTADSLAKGGGLDEAVSILTTLVAEFPDDFEAAVSLARALSWAGDYEGSVAGYNRALTLRPGNPEALSGLGRVLSWAGEYESAVEAYKKSIEADPNDRDARKGFSRTLWWKGEIDAALKEVQEVLSSSPADEEALEIEERLRDEKGPLLRARYSSSTDSDSNELKMYGLSGYYWTGAPGRVTFNLDFYEASSQWATANATTFGVKDSIDLSGALTVNAGLSLVVFKPENGETVFAVGGLNCRYELSSRTRLSAGYNYSPMLDTVALIENHVRTGEYHGALSHDWRGATFTASTAFAGYSDNNSSYDIVATAVYKLSERHGIYAGATSEYKVFSEHTASGYFNPPNIFSNGIFLSVEDEIPGTRLSYSANIEAGIQSFSGKTESTSAIEAGVEWRLTREVSLDAGYKYSRSALESSSGFRFEEVKAGVTYLY
ncbi:MAG: hypothetical protein A2X93_09960 [Deltaproteobacteria bacterium GWC2_56_8]|nr:MAG: hypothetical protein A2X99_07735 [Deltaproteobacteria bacterium GWB2_55_19]OGP32288.1 MAG: hypothetical protein A2X93_09960 [Deltaproteobacteria bacterium GWC2_56_8]HAO93608.1 hypothetical protein [Deltaproteobacteria bacterium]